MTTEEEEKWPIDNEEEQIEPEIYPLENEKEIEQEQIEEEQTVPLEVISKLLSTEEHRKVKNRLLEDCNYILK